MNREEIVKANRQILLKTSLIARDHTTEFSTQDYLKDVVKQTKNAIK